MKDEADVVIVGGGPAGMMAGLLFARAGVNTLVLEKHGDFLRDFRGDTVHPSTMEILNELGMLGRFLDRPHNRIDGAALSWNGRMYRIGELSHLRTPAPFIAMMPQWDFLDFLRDEAQAFPAFSVALNAETTGLVEAHGRVAGVALADGRRIAARKLVIMADGRGSLVRRQGLLPLQELGAPIDVLWFRVPKDQPGHDLRGIIAGDRMLVMIDRGDYWQCACIIAKGSAEALRAGGIAAFQDSIRALAPELPGLEAALPDWDAVRLLTMALDRLQRWHRPGLLAIGDAAHAMSPVGGIGINLAIQDAVCAANVLADPIRRGESPDPLLKRIEARRLFPTRVVQSAQRAAHERVLAPVLSGAAIGHEPPWPVRLLDRFPLLRRIPGRLIGLGIRREHVRSPAIASPPS